MSAQAIFEQTNGAMVPRDADSPGEAQEVARERRERVRNFPSLLKYILKTCESVEALDKDDRVRIRSAQVKCQAYYDGRQDGQIVNGVWRDNPTVDGEILPQDNQYKIQIDKLHMEMCRSNISLEVEATDQSPEMQEAARFFQSRIEAAQERIETEPFVQAENMSLLLKMATFRYTFFDHTAEGEAKELKPKVQTVANGTEERVVVCRTCGTPRERAEFPPTLPDVQPEKLPDVEAEATIREGEALEAAKGTPCESCGDTEMREIVRPPAEGIGIDYEEVPGGQVVTRRPDATMVQLDMSARDIPSSRFIRWRLSLRRCEWEAMFPGKKIPKATERSDEARYAEDLQGHASNDSVGGLESSDGYDASGGEQFERIEGDLVWLDPIVYKEYVNRQGEKLAGGRELPPGVKLGKLFPEGMCVVHIGKTVLDLVPSNKNKHWTMCVYGIREHALHGSGTSSLLGPQDTINDENAFIVANHYYNAAPREFIRAGALEGGNLPKINQVGVITGDVPVERNIVGYAYDKAPATSLAPDVYAFREGQLGSMQEHAGTSSLSMQGAADTKALGTATGVEASRDQAVGRMIPNRKLQAAMSKEWGYQVGELERENCSPERFLKLAKGNEKGEVKFTERGIKAFYNVTDIRMAFKLKPTADSVSLFTASQKKANAVTFGELAARVKDPEILSLLAPNFGIDFNVNEWGAAELTASRRLKEYARISGVITQGGYQASPEMVDVVLSQCPMWARVNNEMDKHPVFVDFYTDWFTSDEAANADDLLRMVVERVKVLHRKGVVAQVQEAATDQAESQIPAKAAQIVSNEVDAAQQAGLQEDAARQQMAMGQQERELQAVTGAAVQGAIPVGEAVAAKEVIMSGASPVV